MPRMTSQARYAPHPSLSPTIYMITNQQKAGTSAAREADPLTERARATWTSGDFGRIAKGFETGAGEFVARLGLDADERVLDVACGTGNLALPAARAGAIVTGVDIAPNLIAQAKHNAELEKLSVTFDIGNVEQLPYESETFDTVITMFGAMFAARPDRAAGELLRVTRSGGRIAMASWTPTGFIGEMFKVTSRYVVPPAGVPSPLLWGTEDAVRERLGPGTKGLTLTRRMMAMEYPFGPEETVNYFRLWYGPTLRAFAGLDDDGRASLRVDLEGLWRDHNRASDGTTRVQSEYLEVIAVVK
jgi:SAM-dependent methyltransferase